jgi:polyhydroxyalkanoate synthesis repressor PhaR
MTSPRVIKKYPNRRLYDTGVCRYIDLADIRALVTDGTDFIVIDKKTGEDITRNTLLLVIAGVEQASTAVMSSAFLLDIIRAHGGPGHDRMASALEETVKRFG